MGILDFDEKIRLKNVFFTPNVRTGYKYVIVREVDDEFWFYGFANCLSMATRICRELGNGLVYEMSNVL